MVEESIKLSNSREIRNGIHDGIPIALGYLVVGFTLGIAARNAGLTPIQGFLASFFNNASAGEYAAFTLIEADAPYLELALMTLIANARYMLMSCVISQKLAPDVSIWHRIFVGFDMTDEIFGIAAARKNPLNPFYNYGAMIVALPGWAGGTMLGVLAGNALPASVVSALSVALYGMFLAIIIPPSRDDRVVGGFVLLSFAASFLAANLPVIMELSGGTRTIILTVVISAAAAWFFPVKEEQHDA
ncbi:AzlC family ABC transporter permease [Schwartzia succinivorans]|jgi:predicted branched-subunit amino acid permease|uniref:Predicted branched-chain amino acid permease (Azaleucine resistance) n=1 Tax=Schwartzia succinivorans DSM 10502 TaxID=1123243 RepID=A0A1M5AB78_9FIRM|nr:AzlC family ABC transporter permease [Schwartzia succinivorans]SHF27162.1 Predicted branched-chain amino acid permease (azaleucine resistance) [Schwartzia succinivorans DSM 10502]